MDTETLLMDKEDIAKKIGELINGKITCPFSESCQQLDQKLSTYGDFENELFCPHCEGELTIKVISESKPNTIEIDGYSIHPIGDKNCKECWSGYPKQCDCEKGLIHAVFGDYTNTDDGSYFLATKCDSCGETE